MRPNSKRSWITFFATGFLFLSLSYAADQRSERVQMRGDSAVLEGEVVDNVVSVMGAVKVDGTVEHDAVSIFGDVTIGPKGSVLGNAVSVGGRVIRMPGSKVAGRDVSLSLPLHSLEKIALVAAPVLVSVAAVIGAAVLFSYTIGLVVLIVVILTLFDKQVAAAHQALVENPAKTLLFGALGFVAIPIVLLTLAVTIIGIPLSFLAGGVAFAAVLLGSVAVAQWLGATLASRLNWNLKPVWEGLLGIAVLFLISLVPVVGFFVHIATHIFGLGAVIQTRFRSA